MTLLESLKEISKEKKFEKQEVELIGAIKNLRKSFDKYLFSFENVVMVASGRKIKNGKFIKTFSIIAGVKEKLPLDKLNPTQIIPSSIKTYFGGKEIEIDIDILEVKKISLCGRTDNTRPALGGDSISQAIGNGFKTCGSIAAKVIENENCYSCFLTAGHVLSFPIIDQIWVIKPCNYHGGTNTDKIGEIYCVSPETWHPDKPVMCDAGIVKLDNVGDVDLEIRNLDWDGWFDDIVPAIESGINLFYYNCFKSGVTTDVTYGKFWFWDASYWVPMTNPQTNITENYFFTNTFGIVACDRDFTTISDQVFGKPGDSGALVLMTNDFDLLDGVGMFIATVDFNVYDIEGSLISPQVGIVQYWISIKQTLDISRWTDCSDAWGFWESALFRSQDRNMLRWLNNLKEHFKKTDFGTEFLKWYDDLMDINKFKKIIKDKEARISFFETVKIGRKLIGSKKNLSKTDCQAIEKSLNIIGQFTSKENIPTLKKIQNNLQSCINKNIEQILIDLELLEPETFKN